MAPCLFFSDKCCPNLNKKDLKDFNKGWLQPHLHPPSHCGWDHLGLGTGQCRSETIPPDPRQLKTQGFMSTFLFHHCPAPGAGNVVQRPLPTTVRLIYICLALPEAPDNQTCWLFSKHHSYVKCSAEVTESSPAHSGAEFGPIVG